MPRAVAAWRINGNGNDSTFLTGKAIDKNFSRIELHIKDLQNALDTAHEVGVPVPLSAGVMEIMQALKVDGKAGDDHGGIIQYYEKLAGIEVRK